MGETLSKIELDKWISAAFAGAAGRPAVLQAMEPDMPTEPIDPDAVPHSERERMPGRKGPHFAR